MSHKKLNNSKGMGSIHSSNKNKQISAATTDYINYIDTAKFLGIYLMLLSHTKLGSCWLNQYIFSFHMPLFFILSGITQKGNICGWTDFKVYFIKKFRSLIIPYLLFALLLARGSIIDNSFILDVIWGTRNSLVHGRSSSTLWFLTCFFLSSILFNLIYLFYNKSQNVKKKYYLIATVIILAIVGNICDYSLFPGNGLFWGMNIAITGTVLMFIGKLIKTVMPIILEKKAFIKYTFVLLLFVCASSWMLNTSALNNKEWHYVVMAVGFYGNYFLFLISAIGSSCLLLLLAKIITNKWFEYIGENTLFFIGFEEIAIKIAINVLQSLQISSLSFIFTCVLTSIIAMILTLLLIPLINSFIPNLVGKKCSRPISDAPWLSFLAKAEQKS